MLPTADTTYGPTAQSVYFDSLNPYDMLGVKHGQMSTASEMDAPPGLARSTGPGANFPEPLWSPHNPLFWFAGLLAATFGLVALSTSIGVRVGPARAAAGVSIGKKK